MTSESHDPANFRQFLANSLCLPIADHQAEIDNLKAGRYACPGRPDLPVYAFGLPMNWDDNPYGDGNWVLQLFMLRMIDPLLIGDREADLEFAFRIVMDWWQSGAEHPVAWKDHATGVRSSKIAYLFSRLGRYDDISRSIVDRHRDVLMSKGFIRKHNHGLFDIQGLRALAEYYQGEEREQVLAFCRETLERVVRSQYTEDGFHKENSAQYYFLTLRLLKKMHASGWYESPLMRRVLERESAIEDIHRLPGGHLVPTGDSNRGSRTRPPARDVFYDRHGYLVCNQPGRGGAGLYLHQICSLLSNVHKHDDLNSLYFVKNGEEILADPGKYKFDNADPFRRYFVSSASHCTISLYRSGELLNLWRSLTREEAGRMMSNAALVERDGEYTLSATVASAALGVVHSRHTLLDRDGNLTIDDDIVAPDDVRTYLNFTVNESLELTALDQRTDQDGPHTRMVLHSERNRVELICGAALADIRRGFRTDGEVAGFTSIGYAKEVPAIRARFRIGRRTRTRLIVTPV